MSQPNAPVPNQAPAPKAPAAPAPVDPKAPVKAPETSPAGADPKASEAPKPSNPLEGELATQFGEEWEKLTPKAKERLVAAEMKSREADKRMQIAAKLKKDLDLTNAQVASLFEALKKDPWTVLKNPALGHDVRKMAEEYVWSMIQEQRMTPEQLEARQNKAELADMRSREERAKQEQQQRDLEALTNQRRQHWEKSIADAIEAAALPKTSYTIRRFAQYIQAAARSKTPADMPQITNQIRQELIDLQSKFLLPPKGANETDEQYEARILKSAPDDFVKLLRKADLKRLRAKGSVPKPGPKPNSSHPAPSKKMSMSDWLTQRDQRLGRK